MITRAWETFEEFNRTDASGLLLYPANTWSGFIPLVLVGLFIISMLATFFARQRLTGKGDFIGSFAAAGFFTAIISISMSLIPDLINGLTIAVCIAIAIIGVILLLVSRD